jgi:outer membrane protein assembly factor BamB
MPRLLSPFVLFLFACPLYAEDWPQFRGPDGQGHYDGKNVPLQWSATKNVAWKQPIPGKGWSSPIVLNGRVYLTTAAPIPGVKDLALTALCLDAAKGKVLWASEVFQQNAGKAPKIHGKNSHASPSPLTDGQRLYVHFGHQGTACLDLAGKVLWHNSDLKYEPVHGNGGSPILVDDKLVFSSDGGDKQFIVALDKANGKVVWKTDRKITFDRTFSFSTPLLITVKGKQQIISPGSGAVMSYDPADGKELWRAAYDGYSVIPRPVFGHGMVFLSTGYNEPKMLAVRVDGQGDVTKTHIAWKQAKGAPHAPSLLLVGDELFAVSDKGLASCLDARTGKPYWQERVNGTHFSASPVYAAGRIYFLSEEGVTTVVKAAKKFEILASSTMKEKTLASFAIADGAIYLRTESSLYRIQAK